MTNKAYDVLMPYIRQNLDWESEKAELLFRKFVDKGFSYDEISNHPDWPSFASAELLHDILPQMIEEMIKRNDTDNFLIYKIISAIDLFSNHKSLIYKERAKKIIELADKNFAEKACQFLEAMKENPPNGPEQVERLILFWQKKLEELSKG